MKKIIYIQYTDPIHWPVVIHGSNILGAKGWSVLFLGAHCISDPSKRFEMDLHENIKIKMLRYVAPGLLQKIQFMFFNIWILLHLLFWRPDVIYAIEKLVCPISLFIKKFFSVKLIYHELLCVNNEQDIRPKFLINSRRKLAKITDLCVLPNKPRLEKFIGEVGDFKNAIYTHAYPPLEEVKYLPELKRNSSSRLKLFYHGMIGPDRLPLQLFEAIEELSGKVELCIAGSDGSGGYNYSSVIKSEIKKRGLEETVRYIGLIKKRENLLKECSNADIGLSLVQVRKINGVEPEFDMAGGAQRPFEYMALGLIPLVPDLDDWKELFVKTGYGYSCDPDDSEDIKEVLMQLYINKDSLFDIGERNRQKILNDWNYNFEFKKIEQFL